MVIFVIKKFLSIFAFLICILNLNSASADYPDYLGGDRNYLLSGGHMGVGWYVVRDSVKVEVFDPPIYIISGKIVAVYDADRGKTDIMQTENRRYLYNSMSEKMFAIGDEGCYYIYPVGAMASTGHEFSGEMFFYIAYHAKFYGGKQWWDEIENRYRDVNFSDHLYEIVEDEA